MFVSVGRMLNLVLYSSAFTIVLSCQSTESLDKSRSAEEGTSSKDRKNEGSLAQTQIRSDIEKNSGSTSSQTQSSSNVNSEPKADSKESTGVVSAVGDFLGTVADSVSTGVSAVADTVKEVITTGKKDDTQKLNRLEKSFFQLGVGGYRGEFTSDSEAIILGDLESVMNFLKYAEFSYSQNPYSEWTQFDFDEYQVVVILKKFHRKGQFLRINYLEIGESLHAEGESYEEDSSCSVHNWINSVISFSLLKIKKESWMKSGSIKADLSLSAKVGCHGLLSRMPGDDQGQKIQSNVEWHGSAALRGQHVRIFRRTWGEWSDFTDNYCQSCKLLESRFGFPDQKLAFLITEPGKGRIHLNRAYRFSGMLFFDLERDNCPVNENSILVTLPKAEVESITTSFDLSKIAITGPWIPVVRQCQSN